MKTKESIRQELYSIVERNIKNPFSSAKDLARFIFLKDLINDNNDESIEFIVDVMHKVREYQKCGYIIEAERIPIYLYKSDFNISESLNGQLYIVEYNGLKYSINTEHYDLMTDYDKIRIDSDYDIFKLKEDYD